ncbi:MAG: Adenosyl-chloride synthase [Phycisphaerae bacterium]|nr:Adenosyl-chloride synthase [Phycisphaerae bacterium]
METTIVTLLTDFGTADHYVAVVKGVILQRAPQVQIVDISHQVPRHDIPAGAYLLAQVMPYFPAGTIHLAVVDPGVGSDRRLLAGRWGEQIILAPDNGLVSFVHEDYPLQELYEITDPELFLPSPSSTFHGRDQLAPTAAYLVRGGALSSVGPAREQPLILHQARPQHEHRNLVGQILYIDVFGDLVTNLRQEWFEPAARYTVQVGDHPIGPLQRTFTDVSPQALVAYLGSSRRLEVARNQGSAAEYLGAEVGDAIQVLRQD